MLRSDHGLDDGSEVVDVGEGFDAEEDVVERRFRVALGFLGRPHN